MRNQIYQFYVKRNKKLENFCRHAFQGREDEDKIKDEGNLFNYK